MRIVVTSLLFLLAACSTLLQAQTSTAQIKGTITDGSGAAISGASIKATQTATGAVRTVESGIDGGYVLANLAIGPYTLEVTKEGFSRFLQSGIVLEVDSNPTVDIPLKVGSVNEQITVEAQAGQVETQSTAIGNVVDNQRVVEMPLNGRNPIELVLLNGMATLPGNGAINNVRNYPTIVISVAGGQGGNSAAYSLDGALYEDPYNNLTLPLPFPDALQEFKVETSALPAQYGYHSGAAVNAVTKSGTNEFHGDLFEFLRNGDLNARDFFAAKRDTLKRNQFGGVIGGPIKRDKLFFFAGIQHTSQRSDPTALTAFVPTADMLAGDFTAVASSACTGGKPVQLSSAAGFVNNQISPTLLNPVALNISKTIPLSSNPCGRTLFGYDAGLDETLGVVRVDFQHTVKNTIFGRYSVGSLNNHSTYDGKNPLSINNYGVNDLNYQVAIGDTYLISTNIVSSLRLSASRTNVVKLDDNYKSLAEFGANYTPLGGHVIFLTVAGVGGGFAIGSTAAVPGQAHTGANPSISEDISWVKGAHQIQFGGNIYKRIMNYWSDVNAVGGVTFNGTVTGLALADFLTGNAVSFSQGTRYGMYLYQYYASLYAQDSWKISRRLSLNYGVRWEPYLSNQNKYAQLDHFSPSLYAQGFQSSVFSSAPVGLAFSGDSQYNCGTGYNCNTWAKFFPRAGLVWDPAGDGKTSIRMSYGTFGDRLHLFFPNQMGFGPPFGSNVGLSNVNLTDPWASYPGGNPVPRLAACNPVGHASHTCAFPTAGQYVTFNLSDYHPMYVHSWNLSVQRQVGNWLFSANYLGNSSIHLGTSEPMNPAVFLGLGPCTLMVANSAGQVVPTNYSTCSTTANQNQRRVFYLQNPLAGQYYAGIGAYDPGGTGSYNGLYLSANKRLSHGIVATANYTWSHCISDIYDQQTGAGGVSPLNRRLGRSNCTGSDQRQLFTLNMVAQTPRFSSRALRIIASDWQVAPILQVRSAQFFTIVPGTDRALTTAPAQTGNLLDPNGLYPAGQNINNWISKAAVGLPALGTYGNLGQNNIKGPGIIQWNMAVSRTFVLRERKTLQVRAEAFNVPNLLNPAAPGAGSSPGTNSLSSPTFGQILGDISGNNGLDAGDPRIIQLAMKFVF
ncbi:MAG: carboxypeptidase regulatory-like domain-containing protein [Bryobacterales bacterium]|nr:carboxypeptidase regulatory-like domain-containing protein [Bryobacterales bacterium]